MKTTNVENFRTVLNDNVISTLQILHLILCVAPIVFGGIILYLGESITVKPADSDVGMIRTLTLVHGILFVGVVFIAPFVEKRVLFANRLHEPQSFLTAIRASLIIRIAMYEGVAMLGLVTCFLGSMNGVLQANPMYYLNALSAAFLVMYVLTNLPNRARLEDVYQEMLKH